MLLSTCWSIDGSYLSDDDETPQSIFTTKVSKLKQAEVVPIGPYLVTADMQEELRKLSEEGMTVKIKSEVCTPMEVGS